MKPHLQLLLILTALSAFSPVKAQTLVLDTTFIPFFDMHSMSSIDRGVINNIWENPKTGKIFVSGSFDFRTPFNQPNPSVRHEGLTSLTRIGTQVSGFSTAGAFLGDSKNIFPINDSVFLTSKGGGFELIDSLGQIWNRAQAPFGTSSQWTVNVYRHSITCNFPGSDAFFFDNGASFIHSINGNCPLVFGNDSFPGRFLIKLDSLGFLDTSFLSAPDPNNNFVGFQAYDSSRIMLYGRGWRFSHYGNKQVDGLCRIYPDGTLDTTFKSPLLSFRPPVFFNEGVEISAPDAQGRFFIYGNFFIKGDTLNTHNLIRVNADGSLDSSFRNFEGPIDSAFNNPPSPDPYVPTSGKSVNDIAPTADGGYLVIGHFDKYQGHPVNRIAKIDSNGSIEPNLINWRGPDSTMSGIASFARLFSIVASKFGGYYIMGDFSKWNGKKSQPIVRIIESNLLVGLEEESPAFQATEFLIYPNPAKEELQIEIKQNAHVRQIKIQDLTGRLLKNIKGTKTQTNYRFNLADLSSGIYLVSLHLENGSRITKKIVKQ